MDKTLKFAHEEDVICAMELVYEHEIRNMLISNIFGLNKALSFINFACINDTDNVITIGSHLEITTLLISYIYAPQKLVTQISDISCGIDNGVFKNINELLSGYKYTEIISSNFDIGLVEYEKESFDVAILGFANLINISEEVQINRFSLETGIEYEMFERLLAKSSKLLKKDGRLVVLTKPGWILKLWSLIHDLGLQLEYDSYSLYVDSNRHPNGFIWLRFIKRDINFNLELHKRNILSLMHDNNIDRLYAHRNNLIFPYVELSYSNSEAYVKLNQNLEYMQYFFSVETTANLAELCEGYTACLVTPSVAQYAYKINKNIVLFERDNRFRENGGLKFVKFDRVICDPPFDIKLDVLANDIVELLKQDRKSVAYIIFPNNRKSSLINAMKVRGLLLEEETQKISIEYSRPPKIVRVNGKDAIQLYKFIYVI